MLAAKHADQKRPVNRRDCAPMSLVCQAEYIQLVAVDFPRRKIQTARGIGIEI